MWSPMAAPMRGSESPIEKTPYGRFSSGKSESSDTGGQERLPICRRYTNLWRNARAVWRPSREPLSITRAWPRPDISTISVTPGFFF